MIDIPVFPAYSWKKKIAILKNVWKCSKNKNGDLQRMESENISHNINNVSTLHM